MHFLFSSPNEVPVDGRHAEVDDVGVQLAEHCPPLIACSPNPIHNAVQADIELVVALISLRIVN